VFREAQAAISFFGDELLDCWHQAVFGPDTCKLTFVVLCPTRPCAGGHEFGDQPEDAGRSSAADSANATGIGKQKLAKYLNGLLDLHLIQPAERRGRNVYYQISPDLALLQPRFGRQ
jgi:hypothetical protein